MRLLQLSCLSAIIVLLLVSTLANAQSPKFKVVTTQLSKGYSPGNDYIQLLVDGRQTCSESSGGDSLANLGRMVVYDANLDSIYIRNGKDTSWGLGSGKYCFPANAKWDSISFGSQILIYNDKNKNSNILRMDNMPGDNYGNFYVVPLSKLELIDSAATASTDSILPSPFELGLTNKEGVTAILQNCITPPTFNSTVSDWKLGSASDGLPGNNLKAIDACIQDLRYTPIFLSVNIIADPRIEVIASYDTLLNKLIYDTIKECSPKQVMLTASGLTLPRKDVNYTWAINGVIDTLFGISRDGLRDTTIYGGDTLIVSMQKGTVVSLMATTNLKCVSQGIDTIYRTYLRPSVIPIPPPLHTTIVCDDSISTPIYYHFNTNSSGVIDSSLINIGFYYGKDIKLYAHLNGASQSDRFKWIKEGIVRSEDSFYIDSNITKTKDTLLFIAERYTPCLLKKVDTTTIIINRENSLPVYIVSFNAFNYNKTIQTNWQTATELNTSHFLIQHSTAGSSFTDVGTVKAIGSGANEYQFTDNKPTQGINYYRLKSIDKDGSFSYSKVVSIQFTVNSNQLSVFPNPCKDKVTVSGYHIAGVQLIDNLGRVLKIVSFKDASNPVLSLTGMPTGIYHLRIQTTDGKVIGANLVVN